MIIADTGFFVALGNQNDQKHKLVIQILNTLDFSTYRWNKNHPFENLLMNF